MCTAVLLQFCILSRTWFPTPLSKLNRPVGEGCLPLAEFTDCFDILGPWGSSATASSSVFMTRWLSLELPSFNELISFSSGTKLWAGSSFPVVWFSLLWSTWSQNPDFLVFNIAWKWARGRNVIAEFCIMDFTVFLSRIQFFLFQFSLTGFCLRTVFYRCSGAIILRPDKDMFFIFLWGLVIKRHRLWPSTPSRLLFQITVMLSFWGEWGIISSRISSFGGRCSWT